MPLAASHDKPVRKRNVVSRGRTGCLTCRRRRLKCDETKPGCNNCRRINLPCEGYAQRITFKDQTNLIVARATGRPVGKKGRSSGSKNEEHGEPNGTFANSSSGKPIGVKTPPSPPLSESSETCFSVEPKQEDTKATFQRDPNTPANSDIRHTAPDSLMVMRDGYLTPYSPISVGNALSPSRILSNSSLCLLGAFEFPEDYTYYEYSANGHLSGLSKVLPLSEFLKSQAMSHHVYNAAMALAALTMSSFEPYSRGSINLRRHAFHHSLRAIQGLNAELSSSSTAEIASRSWNYDRVLSLFATSMLLANFELQRGALLSWRSHMQGAALCLNTGYKQLMQTPTGMLLIRAFARMALLLRLYNKDYSVTSPETMPPKISRWLDLLLKQSSHLRDRMLLLVEEVTALEIQKRQEPELDSFWSSKSSELLCKLDRWRTDVPIDENPVDDDFSGAYLTISSSDDSSLVRVSALVFPNARDPCTSAVNYAAYLCTSMRARTRYLPDSGRIVPPDAERTALTICRIAAGIPPTRFGESFTHSYGMLPSVVGAYRWSTNPGLRNWVKHWLAGYRGPREGIWNIQQTLKLLATMDSLPKPGWHFVAMKVIDEPQEPSPDLDEAHSNEPFKCPGYAKARKFMDEGPLIKKRYEQTANPVNEHEIQEIRREQSFAHPHDSIDEQIFPSLVTKSMSRQQPAVFRDFVLTAFPRWFGLNKYRVHVPWAVYVADVLGTTPALDAAIFCITSVFMGRSNHDVALQKSSREMYSKALASLGGMIKHEKIMRSRESVSTSILLSLFEAYSQTREDSWAQHASGAALLMSMRGAKSHLTGFDRCLYLSFRSFLAAAAFIEGKPCFFEKPEWQSLIDEIRKQDMADPRANATISAIIDVTDRLFMEVVKIPGLMYRVNRHLQASPPTSPSESEQLISRLYRCKEKIHGLASELRLVAAVQGHRIIGGKLSLIGPIPSTLPQTFSNGVLRGANNCFKILDLLSHNLMVSQHKGYSPHAIAGTPAGPRSSSSPPSLVSAPESMSSESFFDEPKIVPFHIVSRFRDFEDGGSLTLSEGPKMSPVDKWLDQVASSMGMEAFEVVIEDKIDRSCSSLDMEPQLEHASALPMREKSVF
ncbi:Zn(II)2Cys6 transcription factor [Aspergillus thermomutatus]|uniref:Zn(2)-C6 fungal-type domain-containing protein n=1 Tax=Aspergillus thermomutatus TaxID=41047 RepID=A0A397GMH5_ASPTH|nr:uncharacterized protein CDV56_103627 [Aspergillus thermomutatus]RHZ50734.1 hypothetical protein CDV56_103627 [Aspergillus thermomutatus]